MLVKDSDVMAGRLLDKLEARSCRPDFVRPMAEAFLQDKVTLEEFLMALEPTRERDSCRAVQEALGRSGWYD